MPGPSLGEDAIDEILYLSRANETSELDAFLTELAAQTKSPKAELAAVAIDTSSKNSALHYAAANGHIDVIKLLLSLNLEKVTTSAPGLINAANEAGNTPLHWAALNGHLECVKLLVELGADVTLINEAGHDAVFEAEINDKKDVVEWLLGAVEELEKGIGRSGEASGDMADEDAMELEHKADKNGSNDVDGKSGTGVEELRKQMEGMQSSEARNTQGG